MTPAARNRVLEHVLEAQSLNAHQRRVLFNRSEATDSALEHLIEALRLATNEVQRAHIRQAVADIIAALQANDAERDEQREIAGHVETPAAEEWSKRKVVEQTRDHLAVLINPILASKHAAARAAVLAVIAAAGPEMTGSHECPDLRNVGKQLGVSKRTTLWDLVREHQAAATS